MGTSELSPAKPSWSQKSTCPPFISFPICYLFLSIPPCRSPAPMVTTALRGCPNNGVMVKRAKGVTAGHWWSLQFLTRNTNFILRRRFLITQDDFFHPKKPFCA